MILKFNKKNIYSLLFEFSRIDNGYINEFSEMRKKNFYLGRKS